MKQSIALCIVCSLSVFCLQAAAETITPLNGQSPETTQQDMGTCQSQASTAGGTSSSQSGGRARGAATGAVAGAAVAEVRGGRNSEVYDQLDSDVKQEHRQNKAKDAAVAGMVVGGSRQRQDRRDTRQSSTASSSAYSTCMQQRGYQINP